MEDRAHLQQMLDILKNRLHILEQQAATLGAAFVPPYLQMDLNHVRTETARVEAQLRQMLGQHSETIVDNLPRYNDIFIGRKENIAQCLEALAIEAV